MLNHRGTQTLNTKHLILRRFEMKDAADMFSNWANDPLVTRYLTWLPHVEQDVTRRVVRLWTDGYRDLNFYQWAVELRVIGQVVGSISVFDILEDVMKGETGYCLSRKYWGRGYMTEALSEVIRFCFDEVGFNRVQAMHDARNPASGRVMIKSGLMYEGRLHQYARNGLGEIVDVDMYAAINTEQTFNMTDREHEHVFFRNSL